MAPTANKKLLSLFERLAEAGISRKYARDVAFPDWWDDSAAENASAFAQMQMTVARHLGLDRAATSGSVRFKKRADATTENLDVVMALCTSVARLVASASPLKAISLPQSGISIRNEILAEGHNWVSLDALLAYCWSRGVAVVHVARMPKGSGRVDGLVAIIDGRPVIVLPRHHKHDAWLLFILAHELGHLVRGHVSNDTILCDQDIAAESNGDVEESEANATAFEILTGDADRRYVATGRWPTADVLARMAASTGEQSRVDPGHIVLNYAHHRGLEFMALANAALNKLDSTPHATRKIHRHMSENLNWNLLPEDSAEFVARVTSKQ